MSLAPPRPSPALDADARDVGRVRYLTLFFILLIIPVLTLS